MNPNFLNQLQLNPFAKVVRNSAVLTDCEVAEGEEGEGSNIFFNNLLFFWQGHDVIAVPPAISEPLGRKVVPAALVSATITLIPVTPRPVTRILASVYIAFTTLMDPTVPNVSLATTAMPFNEAADVSEMIWPSLQS